MRPDAPVPRYARWENPGRFTERSVSNVAARGVRPGTQRLLDLVDTSEAAWPDIAAVLAGFADAGIALDEGTVAIAVEAARARAQAGPEAGNTPRVLLTAAQAEAELGIKRVTVRAWVHRGLLAPAGRGARRQDYFRAADLTALRDSARERMARRL